MASMGSYNGRKRAVVVAIMGHSSTDCGVSAGYHDGMGEGVWAELSDIAYALRLWHIDSRARTTHINVETGKGTAA